MTYPDTEAIYNGMSVQGVKVSDIHVGRQSHDDFKRVMHETYRHKISSNKMKAVFWATSLTDIRHIDRH